MSSARALGLLLRQSQSHTHPGSHQHPSQQSLLDALALCHSYVELGAASPNLLARTATPAPLSLQQQLDRLSLCSIGGSSTSSRANSGLLAHSVCVPATQPPARSLSAAPTSSISGPCRNLSSTTQALQASAGLHQQHQVVTTPSPVLNDFVNVPPGSNGDMQTTQQQGGRGTVLAGSAGGGVLHTSHHLANWKHLALNHRTHIRPCKAAPISQGLAFMDTADQLSRHSLERALGKLAALFADNAHAYTLEEVCAWSEICRRLDFAASDPEHADAVRSALDGRAHDLEPHQLPSVLWLLASSDAPLPTHMEQALVASLMEHTSELGPVDLLDVCESVNRLGMTQRQPLLAAHLSHAAAHCLPACSPLQAVRLAGCGVTHALPYTAPERAQVLSSLCAHLSKHQAQYERAKLMGRALRLASGLAAGQPALQEAVRAVQVLRERLQQEREGGRCAPVHEGEQEQ